MIIINNYKDGVDETWYKSSSIVYTKFIENPSGNFGDLYVTFKGGSTYVYKDVDMPTRYLQFKHEMNEDSAGKSLNSYIKPYYEYEKLEPLSLIELENRKNAIIAERDTSNVYFISGHRDITTEEFDCYYVPALINYSEDPDIRFIVGDYYGVDIMAQDYLVNILKIDPSRITVYHMMEAPRNINPLITKTKGGYQSDEERDAAMTMASCDDIAYVRKGKETSGTAQNILRRHLM